VNKRLTTLYKNDTAIDTPIPYEETLAKLRLWSLEDRQSEMTCYKYMQEFIRR